MPKSWKDKKKEMDDLFDHLLQTTSNHLKVTDAAVSKNNSSSSESESEESSNDVLFRSPQPVKNYNTKKGATRVTTQVPAFQGVNSRSRLTASTPLAPKIVRSHQTPGVSPVAAESYRDQLIDRYVNFKEKSDKHAAKEKAVFNNCSLSPEIKEKPEKEPLCLQDESCFIIESHHSSPGSSDRLTGHGSDTLLLCSAAAVPEINPSDPEWPLASLPQRSIEASDHKSSSLSDLNESVCEEDRKPTEAKFSDSSFPLSSPTQQFFPDVSRATNESLNPCKRLCGETCREYVVEDALQVVISSSSLPPVQTGNKPSSCSAGTCTSLLEDKISQDSDIEVGCKKSPECLFALPIIPGKKYRRSLGFSHGVQDRRQTEVGAMKVPHLIGRKSCFAIHGLLPRYHLSKRKSTIIRTSLLPLYPGILEEAEELKEKEEIEDGEKRVLNYCNSSEIISFEHLVNKKMGRNIKKIGEGLYGEVFGATVGRSQQVVKILPVNGEELCNGEPQKKFEEVLSELMISKALSDLSSTTYNNRTDNFARLTNVYLVCGEYPPVLLKCWDEFDAQEGSENWRPEFSIDQKYLVLGLEHGGEALETFEVMTEKEAVSVFLQIAHSLAVAETQWQFEHRDLHIGNVLLKKARKKKIAFMIDGNPVEVPYNGYIVTIIDFTLSRAQIGPNLVFCDLSTDEGLFEGTGDYQFDIYRLMRENNKNDWSTFHPRSNALWLHYLGKKLLGKMQEQSQPSLIHQYLAAVWEASSATNFVLDHLPNLKQWEL